MFGGSWRGDDEAYVGAASHLRCRALPRVAPDLSPVRLGAASPPGPCCPQARRSRARKVWWRLLSRAGPTHRCRRWCRSNSRWKPGDRRVSGLQYRGVDLRRPFAASGNVADFRPGDPETELLSDLHRAAQPLRVDGDPVAQPARHSSTCAPGAACRALRRHPGAGRCKPAAVRPKSLLWIDVPLRSRSREWLLSARKPTPMITLTDDEVGWIAVGPQAALERRGYRRKRSLKRVTINRYLL
jgi:hypothetical protein